MAEQFQVKIEIYIFTGARSYTTALCFTLSSNMLFILFIIYTKLWIIKIKQPTLDLYKNVIHED